MVFRPGRRFHFVKLVTRGFFPSSPPTGIGARPARHRVSAALAKGPRPFGPFLGSLRVRANCFCTLIHLSPETIKADRCLHLEQAIPCLMDFAPAPGCARACPMSSRYIPGSSDVPGRCRSGYSSGTPDYFNRTPYYVKIKTFLYHMLEEEVKDPDREISPALGLKDFPEEHRRPVTPAYQPVIGVAARFVQNRTLRPEVTKRSDLTHKRTNHELRPPYGRHRARP
jgi:hypothetical protein